MKKTTLSLVVGVCAMLAAVVFPGNSYAASNYVEKSQGTRSAAYQVQVSVSGGMARVFFVGSVNTEYFVSASGTHSNWAYDIIDQRANEMSRAGNYECYLNGMGSGYVNVLITIREGSSGAEVRGNWYVDTVRPWGEWTLY